MRRLVLSGRACGDEEDARVGGSGVEHPGGARVGRGDAEDTGSGELSDERRLAVAGEALGGGLGGEVEADDVGIAGVGEDGEAAVPADAEALRRFEEVGALNEAWRGGGDARSDEGEGVGGGIGEEQVVGGELKGQTSERADGPGDERSSGGGDGADGGGAARTLEGGGDGFVVADGGFGEGGREDDGGGLDRRLRGGGEGGEEGDGGAAGKEGDGVLAGGGEADVGSGGDGSAEAG